MPATKPTQASAAKAKKAAEEISKRAAPAEKKAAKAKMVSVAETGETAKLAAKPRLSKAGKKEQLSAAAKKGSTVAPTAKAAAAAAESLGNSIFDFTVKDADGNDLNLSTLQGTAVLVLNVASKCGKTAKGYEMAANLYDAYHKKGFTVLAFPCNQFGAQEPASIDKVCEFAAKKGAKFPIMDKVNVNGDDAIDLYKYLKGATNGKRIEWNFVAFLCDKQGQVVQRFSAGPSFEAVEKILKPLL